MRKEIFKKIAEKIAKKSIKFILSLSFISFFSFSMVSQSFAEETNPAHYITYQKFTPDITDYASMQNGLELFMSHCSGCHSLQYTRYHNLAEGLKIENEQGKVLVDLLKKNIIF